MIVRTKGRIIAKDLFPGALDPDFYVPPRPYLLVRLFDPQEHRFKDEEVRCSLGQYEAWAVGEWIQVRINLRVWRPWRFWVAEHRLTFHE